MGIELNLVQYEYFEDNPEIVSKMVKNDPI